MKMDIDKLTLRDIQPSQFWISAGKLAEIETWFNPNDLSNFEPITIKWLDGAPMMTDGHTRAVAAIRAGLTRAPLMWEPDEWDWDMYRACVEECRARGVFSPYDLTARVVSQEDYETLWNGWCDEMHARVEAEREQKNRERIQFDAPDYGAR
ncbi:MAG: hypothetical protein J5602_03895 [Clostridia bacterium]|nr:hypothetical protein [Clostridia bacterium]MBO4884436.1 hypothetical protein [Clostridia bacterium]